MFLRRYLIHQRSRTHFLKNQCPEKLTMTTITIEEPMIQDQVLQTTDYHKFSFITGNRLVNNAHAKRIERSMSRRFLFSPLIVNELFQIIDGQHRFVACKKLELPIYYIIVKGYRLEEVQLLNTNSSNWKKIDYLNAYCDLGYPEYLKFRDFMREFPEFQFQTCEMILSNRSTTGVRSKLAELKTDKNTSGTYFIKYFEQGDFRCVSLNIARDTGLKFRELMQYHPMLTRPFVSAVLSLLNSENFDYPEFIGKLKLQPTALTPCVNSPQYKQLIEEIYNWKRREKVNLRFVNG